MYKAARDTAEMSQEAAAWALHIGRRTLSDYENGKSQGSFVYTGLQPQFLTKFKIHGVDAPKDLFGRVPEGDWEE